MCSTIYFVSLHEYIYNYEDSSQCLKQRILLIIVLPWLSLAYSLTRTPQPRVHRSTSEVTHHALHQTPFEGTVEVAVDGADGSVEEQEEVVIEAVDQVALLLVRDPVLDPVTAEGETAPLGVGVLALAVRD